MIRLQQVKLPLKHDKKDILRKVSKLLRMREEEIKELHIKKQSIDARKKDSIFYVYSVDVVVEQEKILLERKGLVQISKVEDVIYTFPVPGTQKLSNRPIIIGAGPAGLFAAYELALHGYAPILFERGKCVSERTKDVDKFWSENILLPDSNVQFGEGGAGTFSDGKLNTLVKDTKGRNQRILELFVKMGAPADILYEAKPHIGTDILCGVIENLRNEIIQMGGEVHFSSCLTDIEIMNNAISKIQINNKSWFDTQILILALGHSARDTFFMLNQKKLEMEAKSFAVGFRVEHPQEMIQMNQYGTNDRTYLKTAPYKVTANALGRGVYSFCMCPGGFVVNASSEEKRLAVNGMSYNKRDSHNANSAIIVAVNPSDFPKEGPLGGILFQQQLEETAYELGNGKIPQQLFGDYKNGTVSSEYGDFESCTKGESAFCDLSPLFSAEMKQAFLEGMEQFDKKIHGFARHDAVLSGIESRTSSPVRILRKDETLESNVKGIYPCGEGAGYAGGIMSAAMDGQKIAEAIGITYKPF